ncbi:MAG: hypothetical protein HQ549_04550 [Candidatus Omnitrophica bacterium]|nr:hypothetical protein [Candidatus Omnitrophota bacterium]
MFWLIIFLISIISLEVASYFIYRSNKDIKEILKEMLKRSQKGDIRTFTPRYIEHPFLAFSLNPEFKNSFGEKIHNKYGFRSNDDFSNIKEKDLIYCAGASSTYCNFIEKNEDTWPHILEGELHQELNHDDIRVINGGCGAWTSYQSLIRFSAWVDVMKPKLVIIYHGKNDFSPILNAKPSVSEIYPDYGNVMRSLRFDSVARYLPRLAKYTYTGKVLYGRYINSKYSNVLWHVYNLNKLLTRETALKNTQRIGSREKDIIFSRFKSFASLCSYRAIPILFVAQKVISDIFEPYIKELNERIATLEDRANGCFVYDFAKDVVDKKNLLSDHIHFSENGTKIFSKLLKNYIVRNITPFKEGKEKVHVSK